MNLVIGVVLLIWSDDTVTAAAILATTIVLASLLPSRLRKAGTRTASGKLAILVPRSRIWIFAAVMVICMVLAAAMVWIGGRHCRRHHENSAARVGCDLYKFIGGDVDSNRDNSAGRVR